MSKKVLFLNNTYSHPTISELLFREGYRVDVVRDFDAGLQQLDVRDYDVIIVQESPEAEIWQLCEKIRHLSAIPLIVISTHASTETCVKAINAGADFFMRKPFGSLELIARVQSLLQRTPALSQSVPIGL